MSHLPQDRPEKLIQMSNQISTFFRAYPHEKAVAGIAEHIRQFWDRRVREAILAHRASGGEGLEAVVVEALDRLTEKGSAIASHQ